MFPITIRFIKTLLETPYQVNLIKNCCVSLPTYCLHMLDLGWMQAQSLFRYVELSMPSICFQCSQVYMTTLLGRPLGTSESKLIVLQCSAYF